MMEATPLSRHQLRSAGNPALRPAQGAGAEWRRSWRLVLACCVGFSFASFMTAAAGVFMGPLGQAFRWNRTQLSLGIALSGLISILLAPLFGLLIDRWGVRRIALPGLLATGISVALFALASGSFAQWIALWAVWGFCAMFVQATVWSVAVAGVFNAGRGLALGVTMAGSAAAQVVAPPLANALIDAQGWRLAYMWMGLGWGGLAFVLAYAFLFDSSDVRRLARRRSPTADAPAAPTLPGLTIREAWRDTSLWRVALSTFLILTVTIAVTVHQFPILVEAGSTRTQAAWLVSLAGIAGIAGKLVTGSLIDRFHARWVGGVTLASTAVAYPLMMGGVGTRALIVVGLVISGYAAGTKMQLCSYLTSRYGGLRHFGAIFGFMTSMIALASVVGPLVAGATHDRFGSYDALLWLGVAVSVVSGALVFSLGRYPDWQDTPARA